MGIDVPTAAYQPTTVKKVVVVDAVQALQSTLPDDTQIVTVNCTVAYIAQCMSWNKCKASCTSMGASSYRWFHDGCCECVGEQCINYGINQSRCMECPLEEEEDEYTDEEMEEVINRSDDTADVIGRSNDVIPNGDDGTQNDNVDNTSSADQKKI